MDKGIRSIRSKVNDRSTNAAVKASAKETGRSRNYRRAICAAAAAAALLFGLGFFSIRAQAGTAKTDSSAKNFTRVIRTDNETDFAEAASRLARKNRGVTAFGTGEVKPYSSARLIVRVRNGKKVDFSKYKPSTVVESNFGISLLQFSTEKQAKKAADSIKALSAVSYVEPDDNAVDTGDAVIRGVTSGESSSGGAGEYGTESIPGGSSAENSPDLTYSSTVKKDQISGGVNTKATKKTATTAAMSWGASYIQANQYAAYVKSRTKKSITVAVVDSGVASHPRLSGRLLKGKDFIDNDNDPNDRFGHGTHVAGIIVDCTPGINVKILPVRALDSSGRGNVSTIGNAIRYAVKKGAKVINLSLGTFAHYRYLEECVAYANQRGVTVVAAAGNENENVRYVCPAYLSSPIVVGAINKKGKRAFFSNYGSSLDVVAPGVAVRSCWLGGGYATADGTSMAVPHISAAAAMYRLIYPSYSPEKIEKLVRSYSKDLGSKGRDNYYGYGVPRMAAAVSSKKASIESDPASAAGKLSVVVGAADSEKGQSSGALPGLDPAVREVDSERISGRVAVTAGPVLGKTGGGQQVQMSLDDPVEESVLKAHIFPSSEEGNAQLHDGSLYRGERLALDVEIVPAQEAMPSLKWKSASPGVAEVDENGVVTALSKGTARIEAALGGESASDSLDDQPSIGSFTVKVEEPSILTSHASFHAKEEEEEVRIHAVVKVPWLQDREAELGGEESEACSGPLVLAMLRERPDGTFLLFGAVDLNGKDAGNVHIHDGKRGKRQRGVSGYSSDDLSEDPASMIDPERGKCPQDKGFLRLVKMEAGSGKADLTLCAALIHDGAEGSGKQAYGSGEKEGEDKYVWKCRLAVYTAQSFEDREAAALKKDSDLVDRIDSDALCTCSFDIRQEIAAGEKEKEAGGKESEKESEKEADGTGSGRNETDRGESGQDEMDQVEPDPSESKGNNSDGDESEGNESDGNESGREESGKEESGKEESGKEESGKEESGKEESGQENPPGETEEVILETQEKEDR